MASTGIHGGSSAAGGGGATTIADGADVAQGTTTDVAWVSGAGTVISLLKKIASAGGSAVSIADGADVAEGTTTDAAVTTDVAGTISAKLRGLLKILDRMIGFESDTTTKSYSLQIGGAAAPGGEWHAATTTNTKPASNAVGLVVRDPSALVTNSGALSSDGYEIMSYSRSDSAMHVVESRNSAPLDNGSEYGVIVRNIPSGIQAISASTLPLPTGAATEATLDTRTGSLTEVAPATDTASSGLNGRLQRIAQRITSLITALGSPFQAGGSIGNTAFGVNNAAGVSAVNIQDGGNSITIDGSITANAGTNLNTSALALETTQLAEATLIGAVTEAAPATDTASSGLNGRLQRIAQRLTSLIALLPAALVGGRLDTNIGSYGGSAVTLGQQAVASSLSVTLAAGHGTVNISTSPGTVLLTDERRNQTILFAVIAASSSGDNSIVAADATKKIKVLQYTFTADAAVTARWKSGATNISGAMSVGTTGGIASPVGSPGSTHILETAVNQALILNLGSAIGVNGHMAYYLEA